jgi:Cu(I)/Ag(I) efflux system membrane fusion protein
VNRALWALATLAAISAAGVGGFSVGPPDLRPPYLKHVAIVESAAAQTSEEVAYYQDPDGKPLYSTTPKTAPDGRAWRMVPKSADVSFDDKEETAPITAAQQDRKIRFYRNPMGLPDTSPTPKKDSMGMAYIPVYEGEESDDGSIKLSAGKIQRTGVRSEPVSMRVIHALVKAPGTIQLDERRISVVTLRSESFVQKVEDVTTGTRVRKGQPLMRIYMPAVVSAAAEYIANMASEPRAAGPKSSGGSRRRLVNLDVPESVITAIEKTHDIPAEMIWTAPRDGIVLERNAIEGMRAQPGDVLFRVADPSVVWAMLDISERDLASIAVGQTVTTRARGFIGRTFTGRVGVIYPQINRETRTARVRIELPNPDIALLPDMYVDAEIDTGSPQAALAVPESSVIDTGARQVVLIDKGEGRFEPRDVKLGARGDGYVEIRKGVKEEEAVVVSANFLIDAESNLKAALKSFADGAAK